MEIDIEAEARTRKDVLQANEKMRQNAIVMVTAKLNELVHDQAKIEEQYSIIYNYILETKPPHPVEKHREFLRLRKLVGQKKDKIDQLKQTLVNLRNGLDPRRLSRDLLEDSGPYCVPI